MRVQVAWLVLPALACSRPEPRAASVGASSMTARSCAAPIELVPGVAMRASTRLGSDRLRGSCLRGTAPECLFALQVDERSELRVALESSDFDGALVLFSASEPPHELRCVDDAPSGDLHHARLDLTVSPGRYLVAVDGASGEGGAFELFTELEPLPSTAQACARARPLSPGVTLRESTRGGAHLFGATCGGGGAGPEHVHKLVVDAPSRVRLRQRAEYDGSLYVRAACEDASSEIVCNDDFQTSGRSLVSARLEPGMYFVFSDSYSRDHSGDYTLDVEQSAEPQPRSVSSLCAEAERAAPLNAGQLDVDTFYGSSALAGSCGGEGAPELVFPLRVDAPAMLVAVLEDVELNAVMYVRRVCGDASSEVACYAAPRIDRAPSDRDSSPPALVAPLDRGSYVLVIDGQEALDLGAATLRVLFARR